MRLLVQLVAAGLVGIGLVTMAVAVVGLVRLTDTPRRLHVTSKAVFIGVVSLLLASVGTFDAALVGRASITALFLLLTAPISSHVIGRAAVFRSSARGKPPPGP